MYVQCLLIAVFVVCMTVTVLFGLLDYLETSTPQRPHDYTYILIFFTLLSRYLRSGAVQSEMLVPDVIIIFDVMVVHCSGLPYKFRNTCVYCVMMCLLDAPRVLR